MHRELKEEATRPPGYSLQAQQRKLNSFVKEYNDVRPHEALGMKTPAGVHRFSEKKYPEKINDWNYDKEIKIRYITHNGAIRIGKSNWLFITTALAGKKVGLELLGNNIYRLYFRQFFLGYVDMKELRVYDIMTYKNELKM